MGKVVSTFIKRPARNWNIENRAIREIERRKDKPVKAPLHPTTQESIEEFQRRELTEFIASILLPKHRVEIVYGKRGCP